MIWSVKTIHTYNKKKQLIQYIGGYFLFRIKYFFCNWNDLSLWIKPINECIICSQKLDTTIYQQNSFGFVQKNCVSIMTFQTKLQYVIQSIVSNYSIFSGYTIQSYKTVTDMFVPFKWECIIANSNIDPNIRTYDQKITFVSNWGALRSKVTLCKELTVFI